MNKITYYLFYLIFSFLSSKKELPVGGNKYNDLSCTNLSLLFIKAFKCINKQGFKNLVLGGFLLFCTTVFSQPTITNFSPNSGPVGTLVTITGTNLSNPTGITIAGVSAIPISNNGTTLVAMVMPGATSGGVSVTTAGGTANGSGNFIVTSSQVPNTQQGNKLVGTGAVGSVQQQGHSVSISADGNTAIVGGYEDNSNVGAAWVYILSGGIWTQQGNKLVGTGAVGNARQGMSVSISADGNTAIVGGYFDNSSIGAAWVYTRSGGVWTQQGNKLVGTGAVGFTNQGYSVSISADGNTAIVGGYYDNSRVGAAWVYTRSGGVWTQQGNKLVGTGAVGAAQQGWSVSISGDGNTAIVGGSDDNTNAGAAWVYTRSGGVWTQQGNKLVGTGAGGNAAQGYSVSLSADGNTAVVGGYIDNINVGAAWVYTRSGGVWAQQGNKLVGAAGNARQGYSVSISADGNTAIVGGLTDNVSVGAAWVYKRSGGVWTQQGNKLVGAGAVGPAQQGVSVSISADGNKAIVGGSNDNSGVGASWVYTYLPPPAPTITSFAPVTAAAGAVISITGTNFTGTSAITLGGTPVTSFTVVSSTSMVAIVGTGATGAVSLTTSGGTASLAGFTFLSAPTITSFAPSTAAAGAVISITGTNFTGTSAITLGGTPVTSFTVVSSTSIVAIVGTGATGALSLTASGGTASLTGFTFILAPTIISFSAATGPVGTLVTITGTNLSNPTGITIGGVSAIPISNNGNTLVAMVMPGATTGGVSVTTAGGTANGSGNFLVTSSQVPNTQQGNKLVGTGAVGSANQGYSISISADGNTAIVGGYKDNSNVGAAWIYTRIGGVWTQQGNKLVGAGAVGIPNQGFSVSISADGNTAIVGGLGDNSSVGAAWVYTRSGGVWTQQGNKLVGTGAVVLAQQGISVSISADGNTAIVGGHSDNSGVGAAWVYTRSGGVWTQQGNKLVGTGAVGSAQQGVSVSISADGNTAIVGGPYDNNQVGASWVYTRIGGVWTQQGNKLVGTGAVGSAQQGLRVSISADGNTAMVGGSLDNSGVGAAWVYTRSGEVWTQQGNKLVGTGAAGQGYQGISVSISADGNTAIVGGSVDNSLVGAAWVYTRIGGVWTQVGNKLVGTGAVGQGNQGRGVSISADGNTAIVGGVNDNSGVGAVWVYTYLPPAPTITSFAPVTAAAGAVISITGTNFTGTSAITLGGTPVTSFTVVSSTSIVAIVGTGATGAVSLTTPGGSASLAGFTFLSAAPTIISFSATTGPVGTLVTITGTNLSNPTAIIIGGVSAIPISNNGNTLVTMVMPGATTGGVSVTTAGGTANGSGNFLVISSQVPNTQQGNKLVGTGAVGNPAQGLSVSISADGNTAIVGGYRDNYGTFGAVGAAWVYTRIGGVWTQQGNKLVGTGTVTDIGQEQGISVSISADGNTAIVGGNFDNSRIGAAWVYTRSGGVWMQQGNKLVGSGAVGQGYQGISVSISADGNTAIVGGYGDNSFVGAAWVYTRSGGVWTQQGNKLVGTGAVGSSRQGISVSVSADGNTAIVGGVNDNSGVGAAWVYTRSGGVWTQQGNKLVGSGAVGSANQGRSVSISADGNTAIVGGYNDFSNFGAAWVYTRSGGVWTQQGNSLVGTGAVGNARHGSSVSISADGNTAIVGGAGDNSQVGAAWAYTRSGEVWTQQGNKLVGSGFVGFSSQGVSVSISADGNAAVVGGWGDNSGVGAAWVYRYLPPAPTITSFAPVTAGTGAIISITGTNFTGTSIITLGGTPVSSFTVVSSTSIFAIVGSGATGSVSLTTPGGDAQKPGFTFGNPSLSINMLDSIQTFGAIKGTYSKVQNYSISGLYLQNDVQIVAPDSFQVSKSFGSGFSKNLVLSTVGGKLDTTKIYVRFKSDVIGNYSGNIIHTSTNAITRSMSVVGNSNCDSTVFFTPIINNISKDTILCFRDSIVLSATNGSFTFYKWSSGETSKNIVAKNSGTYKLQVGSGGAGCLSNESIPIKLNKNTNPIPSIALVGDNLISTSSNNYRWYFNNNILNGNNSNLLKPSKVGFYSVETSSDKICWDRSTDYPLISIPNSSIKDSIQIKTYPNPTSTGLFHVVVTLTKNTNVTASVTVVDGNGNVLMQTNKFIFYGREIKIPVTLSFKGTVFAKVEVNGVVKIQTVILQ